MEECKECNYRVRVNILLYPFRAYLCEDCARFKLDMNSITFSWFMGVRKIADDIIIQDNQMNFVFPYNDYMPKHSFEYAIKKIEVADGIDLSSVLENNSKGKLYVMTINTIRYIKVLSVLAYRLITGYRCKTD